MLIDEYVLSKILICFICQDGGRSRGTRYLVKEFQPEEGDDELDSVGKAERAR